jgi:hypothetical protein
LRPTLALKVPTGDAETEREDGAGEEAAAVAEAVPAAEVQQSKATATPVELTAPSYSMTTTAGYTALSPPRILMVACATRVTTTTYVVRRIEEYSYPDTDDDSVDLHTNPHVPIDTSPTEHEQTPHSATTPIPPVTANEREPPKQASPEAGYDDDWRYYPEYDTIF